MKQEKINEMDIDLEETTQKVKPLVYQLGNVKISVFTNKSKDFESKNYLIESFWYDEQEKKWNTKKGFDLKGLGFLKIIIERIQAEHYQVKIK